MKNNVSRKLYIAIAATVFCGVIVIALIFLTQSKGVVSNTQNSDDISSETLDDNPYDLEGYLTSVEKVNPITKQVIGVEIYKNGILPYFYDPATMEAAEMRQFDIRYGDGIVMDQASYDSDLNLILGEIVDFAPEAVVRIEDINFDGRDDIGVLSGIGYGGVNLFYSYYIAHALDSEEGVGFISEYLPEDSLSSIAAPEIDIDKKTITSLYSSSFKWYAHTWRVEEGKFIDEGEVVL
jgi:hypothetical protein